MATRLSAVPERITAGTSVELTLGYTDYPANDGWTLKLFFHGKNDVTIDGADVVAAGSSFDVTITSTKSALLGAGATAEGLRHDWFVQVTKASNIKIADSGSVVIEADPATATAGALQSFAERMVALIRAAMLAQTGSTVFIQAYQIANRGVTYGDRDTWLKELAYWESRAQAEQFPGRFGQTVRMSFTGTESEV